MVLNIPVKKTPTKPEPILLKKKKKKRTPDNFKKPYSSP